MDFTLNGIATYWTRKFVW